MTEKITCSKCSKRIAAHIAICPFCNAKLRTQEDIDNDPIVKESLAKMALDEMTMKSEQQKTKHNKTSPIFGLINKFMSKKH